MDDRDSVSVSSYAAIVHVNLGHNTARLKESSRQVDGR